MVIFHSYVSLPESNQQRLSTEATHQRRRDTANQKPRCWSQYNLREHQLDLPRKDRKDGKGRGAYPKSAIFDGKMMINHGMMGFYGILVFQILRVVSHDGP